VTDSRPISISRVRERSDPERSLGSLAGVQPVKYIKI